MGNLYTRKILNNPEVHLSLSDPFAGIIQPNEVTLELSNTDGYFDTLDLRGELITYSRFDKANAEYFSELSGKVTGQTLLTDRIVLRTVTHDLDALQTLIPRRLVTTALFANAPAVGIGKPIPVIFGISGSTNKVNDAWEMPYVGEDLGGNHYDYLLGQGTFTNITLYRDSLGNTLLPVTASEYAINTELYPGFTVARFPLRQADGSGNLYRMFAAGDGQATERNFARAIQSVLNDTTWGLGLPIFTSAFDTAATALDTIGGLYCDARLTTQRPALDVLNALIMVRGIQLDKSVTGAWSITVDQDPGIISGQFGHGKGQSYGLVKEFSGLAKTPSDRAVKSFILEYRQDQFSNTFLLSTTARSVLSVGKELRVQNDMIRDRTTADKTADYMAKRHLYGDEQLTATIGQGARKLMPGQLISYSAIRPSFTKTFVVFDVARRLDSSTIQAMGWNVDLYTYTAQALPAEPPAAP